jgi:secretion/DNA translocation related TadE-like protein
MAVAVLLVLAGFGIHLGSAIATRHRVEAAADLAALAAAAHGIEGEPVACGYAERVASGMSTRLVSCQVEKTWARVELEARAPMMASLPFGSASGRARAGPVPRSRATENGM